MFKTLTAGITALSLTLASAAPAQAQSFNREDVGKLLIGLAAVAVIGAAIEENRDRRSNSTRVHDTPSWNGINSGSWSSLNRQHQQFHHQRRAIPASCLRDVQTRFGTQPMFGQRCLERNYAQLSRLPARCAVRVYTNNGPRQGFDPLCLREQGYRADRHH
ncbi:MAG: hypothetical protein AAGF56_02155 [Pseudomonadota bacterium]